MRYTKEELQKKYSHNIDYLNYLHDYIEEVEALHATFKYVVLEEEQTDVTHRTFAFEIEDNFIFDKDILERDDDSQPSNTYQAYFGELYIYESRGA